MASSANIKIDTERMEEVLRPIRLLGIAGEAIAEVKRAREKHGSNADLADGTGRHSSILQDAHEYGLVAYADEFGGVNIADNHDVMKSLQALNDYGMANGRTHTRIGVLLEEAFEAAETDNLVDLRTEVIQFIAMGLDWVADIDVRS